MKKLFICLITMLAVLFTACKDKEKDVNYADQFVGTYTVTGEANLNIPGMGEYPLTIPETDATITKVGEEGDVILSMLDRTVTGYARKDGLHVDPFIVNQEIAGFSIQMTVVTPVIAPPENGVITTTATISASTIVGTVSGVANITGVKK